MTDPADLSIDWHLDDPAETSVLSVAKPIIKHQHRGSVERIAALCFYALGWHSLWADTRLFDEPIYAGTRGPKIPRLHDDNGRINLPTIMFAPDLPTEADTTVSAVLESYGQLDTTDLLNMLQVERPFYSTRVRSEQLTHTPLIDYAEIANWFRSLHHPAAHTAAGIYRRALITLHQLITEQTESQSFTEQQAQMQRIITDALELTEGESRRFEETQRRIDAKVSRLRESSDNQSQFGD